MPEKEERQWIGWLDAAREGDEGSLRALLEAARPPVEHRLRTLLDSAPQGRAVAEELGQDVLLRLVVNLKTLTATTDRELRAWLLRTATNLTRDWYRSRRKELELRIHLDVTGLPALRAEPEDCAYGSEMPLLGSIIREAESCLSAETRTVIWLRLLGGVTWAEAASAVGTTRGGARSRFRRGLERLRREIFRRIQELPGPQRRAAAERIGHLDAATLQDEADSAGPAI